jgi:hypothetical protein
VIQARRALARIAGGSAIGIRILNRVASEHVVLVGATLRW